mmetsp:Transcript_10741/g.23455  ORF Transcript_10741/g.23455 Transcript_10741/m.23455 type:complete len:87 (+) Transcript_10741:206-466(+)
MLEASHIHRQIDKSTSRSCQRSGAQAIAVTDESVTCTWRPSPFDWHKLAANGALASFLAAQSWELQSSLSASNPRCAAATPHHPTK